ncbi:hypothetical protein BD779DRAFT_1608098 [Infundibulicybe gibba]|nr:hypothetical protein BD779DRAFT_1608098 [Infundibulicybe gibba]
MRLDALLPRQSNDGCITNCPPPPPCNCTADQDCFQINRQISLLSKSIHYSLTTISNRDCFTCTQTKCVTRQNKQNNNGSGGVSKGALAGAVIGILIFLAGAIFLFVWYRRKSRLRKAILAGREGKADIPAPAETVLSRPDPAEKNSNSPPTELTTANVYSTPPNAHIDPESQHSSQPSPYSPRGSTQTNPFEDNSSIQTAGTEATNAIPIALVSPDSHRASSPRSESATLPSTSTFPTRPARSPDLNLNLDHVNISRDSLKTGPRNSYMSNASYSSDFLNEAPMIITPTKGTVRQVLGVVKAEVINAPGSLSPLHSPDPSKPHTLAARPSIGSPLAASSFGPGDVVKEVDEGQASMDPFSDMHSPASAAFTGSPSASTATIGQESSLRPTSSVGSDWIPEEPNPIWSRSDPSSRPSSLSTQAGSVIDIGSATRVNVGLKGLGIGYASATSPLSANSLPRTPYRTTMGRLITPSSSGLGTLEEQQQRALAHAHAQAQGMDQSRRISGSSVMSATSTRADSILESFPFVPPSPISDRPVRSPPVSPLGQQSFTNSSASPSSQVILTTTPPSPLPQQVFTNDTRRPAANVPSSDSELPAPPDRRTLGLSTGSQFSTTSNGLGSFPFQIDNGANSDGSSAPPSAFGGRQRASLDTLAITSDLSSYPLGFDRDSMPHLPKQP